MDWSEFSVCGCSMMVNMTGILVMASISGDFDSCLYRAVIQLSPVLIKCLDAPFGNEWSVYEFNSEIFS